MRKSGLVGILFVVLFLLPVTSPNVGPVFSTESLPPLTQYDEGYSVSDIGDLSSGTGLPLDVNIGGVVSNEGEGSYQITSGSSGSSSVTIEDGWTGSNLNAEIDTLTMVAEDVLNNGDFDDTHNELFIVTDQTTVNDNPVLLPDGWTLVKDVPDDNPHPTEGAFHLASTPSGYGSTYGVRMGSTYTGTFDHVLGEEIYISQMVSIPWREVYSVTISFRYFVESSSDLEDQVNLFIRIGRVTREFHVFESGDPTDTWLTETRTILASSMSDLSSYAIQFDIGLTSDQEGQGNANSASVRIDDVKADFTVRPFPEQVDLKANGTLVWGSTSGSVYPYVPDDANRDCYDTASSGLDLDGYGNDGGLGVGMYSTGYDMGTQFDAAFQFPVDIPNGAIITSAHFEVEATMGSASYMPGMRLSVADLSNMTAFTAGGGSLEERYSWLDTSIDWTVNSWLTTPVTRYNSPDMAPLIQKVVSNSSWVSGNYLCVMAELMYTSSDQNWNDLKGSSHYDGTHLARLFVEYVIPENDDTIIFFDYQKDITIDYTKVAATLTDFPVMIDLIDTDLKTKVLSGGNDIVFTIDGQPVAHEIELFNQDYSGSEAHLVAWLKVPTLSSTTDTVITMHYGCANAPAAYSGKVWDDYSIVQHLNDDPSGIQYDSTSNNYDGTSYGGLSTTDLVTGKIGDAIDFDGSDDMISVGQIFTDDWSEFTISVWVNHDGFYDDRIFSKAPSTTVSSCIVHLAVDDTGTERVRLSTDGVGGSAATSLDSIATPSNLNWHYLTFSWSAVTQTIWLYVDGSPDTSYFKDGDSIDDSDVMFVIANWGAQFDNTRHWHGLLDEIRMLPIALTDEWIETEFNNQDDPSNFYSVGSETSVAETWTDEGDTRIVFTTSSLNPITLQTYITMDISGEGQTLDESLDPGTSYFIESGSTIVNWTAKVMVSPPAGATSMGFSVEYPMAEWKPTTVLNPFNDPKTDPQDWWHQAGTLTINASSIDFWGIWTLKFISWNFVDDVTMGRSGEALGTTATFNIGDSMKFLATTPTLNGATVGFVLTDPTDTVTYTGTNTTGTTPTHKFPSFEYRKDFTINPANVHDDVTNFPVALDFTDTDLHDPTKVRDDGSDIMFAQGDVILAHDIEYFVQDYDIVNAWLVAWVSANLSSSVTSTITMYYGSPVVDNLEDPDGVWGSDYDAVWHMGETVTDEGSGSIHYDSTTSNYDGIQNGNDETLTSRIGYAQNFDGNDYIAFDETLTPPDDVMISGWFRITETHDSSDNTQVLMEKYLDADRNMVIALAGSDYGHGSVPAGSLVFKVESQTGSAIYKWTTRTTWTAGWYYIACQADEDSPTSNQIFVGFASAGWDTDAASSGGSADANMSYVEEWRLGGGNYETGSGSNDAYFTGQMDEWRVGSTHQSLGWLQTEWANQQNPTGFAQRGSEIARSSPDHTFTQSLGTTAPAGVWTVSAYYNDTGTSVSTRTGLFERTFTVKRDTTLTLTKPTDAVGDRLSVKTAGDAIIIEFELEDSLNSQPIAGATVTMNWTSPVTVTLDDYGGGVYGKVLDTDDLADAKEYRIEVDSTHPYYNDASEYFNIELNHNTELDYSDVSTTPVGEDFTVTVTFTDTYTGSPITDAIITFGDNSPVQSFTHEGGGDYSVTISSTALSPGDHQFILKAQSANNYLYSATVSVTFELRAHYTAISVTGDFLTPNGVDTDVTVVLIDFDTGLMLDASVVTSFTFTSSQGIQVESATFNLDAALDTDSWAVGVYSINVTMIMSDSDYYTPQLFTFTVEIRPHYTALTVSGSMNQPYGNTTPLEIHLTDLDTGVDLTSSIVTNFNFAWQGDDYDHGGGGSLIFNLDTSTWSVGATTVTVTTTMSSSLYYEPANYQFDITIRSMDSLLYTRPPASALYPSLVFPSGVDFEVYLQLNVSELGTYYGDAIIGRIAGEFSVSAFTIKSVDVSEAAIGRYKISIDASNFGDGAYELVFYFTSNDDMYGDTFIVIRFSYRPIISYLTSPNYPQVITPYLMDVQISLNYTDADFGTGIEGATVSSPDHPTWLYGAFDHTGGLYTVWIDVSSLTQGTYNISITLDKPLYDAKTLQFRIVVREAYTSVLPSVGSLDIPLGSSISFYVDYTDIDRFIPIDNSTSDTEVECLSWTNFDVVYVSGLQKYQITFYTTDSDPISQNVIHTFTFSKGTNYQVVSFNISVSIRTHNTDFRIVSAIEPTTTIGTFNISVYYGDLDDGIGINSVDVDFWVENTTGVVSSSYDFDVLGDGYYIISVPASQFGLGLQDFTVYADWTAAIAKYQDKSFVTSANVVGRVSALTLLIAADPTPYNEDMSYTFFFSDTGTGISNLTGNVFITVSFQGETVNPADITIIDWSLTQPGNYSIEFNTGIFSRIGVIYMDISVEWAKGVAPYYSNRTDTVSVRVLQRDTLLQVSPPSPTNYGEIAAFNFTFDDITGEPDVAITDDIKLLISMNVAFTYSETSGVFTIFVDTTQFGAVGPQTLILSVTWDGVPFYANKTGRSVYLSVINRDTFVEYLAPAPTQYLDEVMFNVTWTDITGGANIPITGAIPLLYDGASLVDGGKWSYVEITSGVYQFTLNTTYVATPGTYILRVSLSIGTTGIVDVSVTRQFNVRYRITLLSAEPVATVPFNSSIVIVLYYQDLFTAGIISNDSADGYPATLQIIGGDGSGWIYTATWRPGFGDYILTIETYNQPYMTYTTYTLNLRMSYAYQSPYYSSDDLTIEFQLRNRVTSLGLTDEAETTPYGDDAEFTVFFGDVDAGGVGVAGATITVLNNSIPLVENTHYTLVQGSGFYTITIESQYLGSLGSKTIEVEASWSGTPYYDTATRDVHILVRQRETNVEITVAPSQTRYLDDVIFTFIFSDLDAGTDISTISASNIHLYFLGYIEIFGYTVNQAGASFEITINSTILSSIPVSGLSVIIQIDWDDGSAPFYTDDETIMKVTITGRAFLVEIDQIQRTPKDDVMVITITVTDMDNDNLVVGAIILFTCQNESLVEGVNYDRFVGGGVYSFDVYTSTIPGIGILLFDIEVQWAFVEPFYSNQSSITVNGLVDYVRTSLQASAPSPSTVQISADLYFLVTYRDLDHGLPISGAAGTMIVTYVIGGAVPTGLSIFETGTPGVYNVSFSTSGLAEGSYDIEITIPSSKYSTVSATPQFTVTTINTNLVPVQTSYQVNWKEEAYIQVDFMDLLHGYNISGASVSWYLGGTFGGFVTEIGTSGRYQATIETSDILFGAGTFVLTVTASAPTYTSKLTTITLVVLSLPSDIIFIDPPSGVFEVPRGNAVPIIVQLNDTLNDVLIGDLNVIEVYISFQSLPTITLTWNGLESRFEGVLPGSATILDPGSYDVRVTAIFDNYQPASEQFKILILQTATNLEVLGDTEVDAVYSEIVTFRLNFTENAYNTTIDDADVWWFEQSFEELRLNFTFDIATGTWILVFNTTQGLYGTWGLTFRASPNNATLAPTTTTVTLTIARITTEVIAPPISPEVYWGWTGNISFTYNGYVNFTYGVTGAGVFYDYGTFVDLPAYDLGNGTYLVFINTTYLTSNAQHRIIVDFAKDNYEERTGGINIFVNLRPTDLSVLVDDARTYATSGDTTLLEVPMGDSIDITFFLNDTSLVGGLNGGLDGAGIIASLISPSYFSGSGATLTNMDSGYYRFTFDTNNLTLYEFNEFVKIILDGQFFLSVEFSYPNRISQTVTVQIKLIDIPVQIVYTGPLEFDMIHGDLIEIEFTLVDTWHNTGVGDANILFTQGSSAVVASNVSYNDGNYLVTIRVVGTTGDSIIRLTLVSEFHENIDMQITVSANPNDTDVLIAQVTQIGLPISLLIITLLGLYVRVWSVPKRIRQINGQVKALGKGKIPKPITDVKGRTELIAELFNDTYAKLAITRTAAQMPEDSIPIDIPEMGELLIQLAILTNLDQTELDEFQADIAKMKISEQAAFVKEVIVQEAIRAARRDGKTVEEVIEEVEKMAQHRLAGETVELEAAAEAITTPKVETVFLDTEEPVKTEIIEPKPSKETFEEPVDAKTETMSVYEIEELRKELERKGVPPHEINTIVEQARELPRELIEELVKSLETDKK